MIQECLFILICRISAKKIMENISMSETVTCDFSIT